MGKLVEIFNINKGDIVSIVGSGGKTTLMLKLAQELRDRYSVMVSTSAKMLKPAAEFYDYLYTDIESYRKGKSEKSCGITVISKNINIEKQKLMGIDEEDLNELIPDFDIILLEADGSKNLPVKGWKNHEPPVLEGTTKTIGVIPANFINKRAERHFIYGFDEFNMLTCNSQYIDFEAIGKICSERLGIFKNSRGRRYLFLNKAGSDEELNSAYELTKYLNEHVVNNPFDFSICFGSLEKEVYYEG